MSNSSQIALILELLESAESNLRSARQMMTEMAGKSGKSQIQKLAEKVSTVQSNEKNQLVIEGAFDGQNMIGPDGKVYSVPANYASKSKLVQGDILKLTITDDGTFIYKQIGPIEKRRIVGTLSYDDGQYRVLASGKSYKVLLASVTYFRAEIGDKVTIIIPEADDTEWAAIENVLPKVENGEVDEDLE